MTQCKFANITFLEVVMAVVDVGSPVGILMMTMFFRKLVFQMPERIHRLEQYREQHCRAEKKLYDAGISSHAAKIRNEVSNGSCKITLREFN